MKFTLPFLRSDPAASPGRLILDFESLGDNCEFGLVQRYTGVEPLGLFRFSSTRIPDLIHALDTDLVAYGAEADLVIETGGLDYLFCRSRRYGFAYNTGEFEGGGDKAALLAREYKKVAYLKGRFLADLAAGEKILIRKGPPGETFEEVMDLVAALRRHGPALVLRVLAADDAHVPGEVSWRADGVMEGFVERFAPYEQATEIALEGWLALCRNAWALARNLPASEPDTAPDLLGAGLEPALSHVAAEAEGVVVQREARRLDDETLYSFSAWIWLPEAFRGERVAAEFGRLRLGHRDADLGRRGVWQRVWSAARLDRRVHEAALRLRYEGPPGERFWSTAWRLEEGPVPGPALTPMIVPER